MDELAMRVARQLACNANQLTTYSILAAKIGWYNPTGQGLGRPLTAVLQFCLSKKLPLLTTIVCATGTDAPSARGVAAIEQVAGAFDLRAEQKAVRKYDWRNVPELGLADLETGIDFGRLYAKRVDGYGPEHWGMLAFSKEGSRKNVLDVMEGRSIFVVHFCSPNNRSTAKGAQAILYQDLGRVLGIAEIAPTAVSSETHVHPDLRQSIVENWGHDRWPFGLLMKRAWRFGRPPLARSAMPDHFNATWPATNEVVQLTRREAAELAQHPLHEVPVFGQERQVPQYVPPEPALYTYMVVCNDDQVLAPASAAYGERLVKIGISNDKERRLQELNGNHLAVIFGVRFNPYSHGKWNDQNRSMEVERQAHDWCHANGRHASGEYFFVPESKLATIGSFVRLGR